MSIVARAEDRFSSYAPEARDRGNRLAVSYGSSIVINALFLALMIMGIEIYTKLPTVTEIPIEVVVEATPRAESPTRENENAVSQPPVPQQAPVSQPPPALSLNAQAKATVDPRDIADKDRQRQAEPDEATRDGDGTDKSPTAAASESSEDRDGEYLKKARIAPPGPDSRPTAKDKPTEEAADETTAKR